MSTLSTQPSVFYTELDTILDTRLGTLLKICKDKNLDIIDILKNDYFNRTRDLFPKITSEEFSQAYQQRDRHTLKASIMTPAINLLRKFILDTFEGNVKTPFSKEPRIVINVYPYKLDEQELKLLRSVIVEKIKHTLLEFVNLSPSQLTPSYLKKETEIALLYDPFDWLETHSVSKLFTRDSCPAVSMFGPLIIKNNEDLSIDIKGLQSSIELLSKPFVDLHLVSVSVFSAVIGKYANFNNLNNTTKTT